MVNRKYTACNGTVSLRTHNSNTTIGMGLLGSPLAIMPTTRFTLAQGGHVPVVGAYTSPVFPSGDEGNVVEWGQVIVTPEFDDDNETNDAMDIDVLDENGTVIANYELDDGNTTYSFDLNDINGFDAAKYTSLSLRANFDGGGSPNQCIDDIVPLDADFWGLPTGLNEKNQVIGFQRLDLETKDLTAFTWRERAETVTDLHAFLPTRAPVDNSTYMPLPVNSETGDASTPWLDRAARGPPTS